MTLAPWWLVVAAVAAIVALAVVACVSRGREARIPVADLPSLRGATRRTAALRFGLVALVGVVLASAYLLAPKPTGRLQELVSSGRPTVVVLDVSQSVSDLVYREIARTLEGLVTAAGDTGRLGLVVFSDVAQEALPPGSKASELQPYIRYFRPRSERGVTAKPNYYRAAGPTQAPPPQYPLNPWYGRFSGGTQISTGLAAAREALERGGAGGGRVILLSDLAESDADLPRLAGELSAYGDDPGLDLRIVALPPATEAQKQFFARIAGGEGAIVDSLALSTGNAGAGEPSGPLAVGFLVVVGVLAISLAVFELRAVPLAFAARPGEEGPR